MKRWIALILIMSLLAGVCVTADAASPEEELWDLIREAYVYSFPLIIMDATMTVSTNTEAPVEGRAPVNQLSHARHLPSAAFRQVVTPNVDTLYSQMFIDLSEDAVVLHKPASDRYLAFQVMDAWSDTVAVLGTGADTQDECTYLLTGPNFTGDVPEGMTEVKIPTAVGWVLGRTVCYGEDDLENIYALQDQMDARTLSLLLSGGEQPKGVYDEAKDLVPVRATLSLGPQEFFDRVNELLIENPGYPEDAPLLEKFAAIGIGPGLQFDAAVLGENIDEKWAAMVTDLPRTLAASTEKFMVQNGSFNFYGDPISRFGQEYDYRAMIAIEAFGANPVDVAVYMKADSDDAGEALNAENSYVLHFEPDALPPVGESGFWSITAYGDDDFLIDNPVNRYAVSDRTALERNEDGSLDLYLQAEPPVDHTENWLPVGNGGFHLYMRIYLPQEAVFTGEWAAPSLTIQDSAAADTDGGKNPETLKTSLEEDGFYVQQGVYRELDTVKEASAGRLLSCFGNNAGSTYIVFSLPAAPEQDTSLGSEKLGWPDEIATVYDDPNVENAPANPYFAPGGWEYKLRQDEVIVLITPLPGECKYYSFINYIMFTADKPGKYYENIAGMFSVGNEDTGLYHPIFGSIGNSVNMTNIRHSGESIFDTEAVIVIGANQDSVNKVTAALNRAGYDESMINIMPIPEDTYRMGLWKGADTFSFLQRVSQATDKDAYREYLDGISDRATLYRVTPVAEADSRPFPNETVIPRGDGTHEVGVLPDAEEHLEAIREALITEYAEDYDYEEYAGEIAVPEGLTAYFADFNAKGDNRDAMYLMTPEFTLDSDEDFVVVYGVNHAKTGKALYANAVLYAKPMLNGVTSIYDSLFEGSADAWLGEDVQDADSYYVYRLARTADEDYTAVIPYSTGNEQGKYYGVDNGNPVLMAFRAYLDETGTGASYYEVIYDRTIVFHKK